MTSSSTVKLAQLQVVQQSDPRREQAEQLLFYSTPFRLHYRSKWVLTIWRQWLPLHYREVSSIVANWVLTKGRNIMPVRSIRQVSSRYVGTPTGVLKGMWNCRQLCAGGRQENIYIGDDVFSEIFGRTAWISRFIHQHYIGPPASPSWEVSQALLRHALYFRRSCKVANISVV